MEVALTGLGLFVRKDSGDVPHVTSVAIDLGLRAAAPQVDRPWACRISTPLSRPAPDGLTRDVHEIERLAALAKATVRRLSDRAIFAAAVTSHVTRTWLLYAAGSDAAELLLTVKAAAETAFAAQPGYVASVTVESDPNWAGYLALYPTATEVDGIRRDRAETTAVSAARTATKSTVQSLRASGVDLSRPSNVRYTAWVPTDSARTQLLDRAAATGLRVMDGQTAADGQVPLYLIRSDLPDLAIILRTERWLIHELGRLGGRYEGWAAESTQAA
jgi:hypothetical protein